MEIVIFDNKELVTYSKKQIDMSTDDFKKTMMDRLNQYRNDGRWNVEMIDTDYSACVGRIEAWNVQDSRNETITIKNIE